ncbi:MAG: MBOAT family O-acyltransferase [Janthinobacterium lividum]
MLFNSQLFLLVFLPIVLAAFYGCALLPDPAGRIARQLVLVTGSLVFYAAWNWRFVPVLVLLALVTWWIGRRYADTGRAIWPIAGIALNLGVLGVFKYANFIATNVESLVGASHTAWSIVLPLGISFFVFQKISYLVDLKRGGHDYAGQHRYGLLDFSEFVTFFPALVAGPLVRHNEIIPQFEKPVLTARTAENLSRGAVLFLIGLTKKAGIADTIAPICDPLFAKAAAGTMLNGAEAWAASIAYSLQIFFDFSGYSDMAIGLALMFGLTLPVNFNAPYRSTSLRDFWRRWHITLSRFLRDYLYIPLGGNRSGVARQCVNLGLTMLLGGLWHGAAWTFVAWGGLHGFGLAVNHLWTRAGLRMPAWLGWIVTMLFVIVGWVVFRSPDFSTARHVLGSMAGLHGIGGLHLRNAIVLWIAMVVAVIGPSSQKAALSMLRPSPWLAVPAGAAFVFLLFLTGGRVPNEFIYFQF